MQQEMKRCGQSGTELLDRRLYMYEEYGCAKGCMVDECFCQVFTKAL